MTVWKTTESCYEFVCK